MGIQSVYVSARRLGAFILVIRFLTLRFVSRQMTVLHRSQVRSVKSHYVKPPDPRPLTAGARVDLCGEKVLRGVWEGAPVAV